MPTRHKSRQQKQLPDLLRNGDGDGWKMRKRDTKGLWKCAVYQCIGRERAPKMSRWRCSNDARSRPKRSQKRNSVLLCRPLLNWATGIPVATSNDSVGLLVEPETSLMAWDPRPTWHLSFDSRRRLLQLQSKRGINFSYEL